MARKFESLTRDAMALSEGDRARLAYVLLPNLEDDREPGVEQAWDEVVSRRLDEVRRGVASGRFADEVFGDARARHGT
jgi:hypothetical protein